MTILRVIAFVLLLLLGAAAIGLLTVYYALIQSFDPTITFSAPGDQILLGLLGVTMLTAQRSSSFVCCSVSSSAHGGRPEPRAARDESGRRWPSGSLIVQAVAAMSSRRRTPPSTTTWSAAA